MGAADGVFEGLLEGVEDGPKDGATVCVSVGLRLRCAIRESLPSSVACVSLHNLVAKGGTEQFLPRLMWHVKVRFVCWDEHSNVRR